MALSLQTRHCYPRGGLDLPICVLMHGYTDSMNNFDQAALERIAAYGLFVVVPDLRANASKDNSGRELHDIYDAVEYFRAAWPTRVSSTLAAIVGYSGGGGNALAAACKFPDYWTTVVSHFGMSDYGYDATYGWWAQNVGQRATIEARMGGDPSAVPNAYYARYTLDALPVASGVQFHFFHDDQDSSVNINQSQRATAALDGAGLSNYAEHYTTTTDSPRWTHGYPNSEPLSLTEAIWSPDVLTGSAWTIPSSGAVTVIGYMVTKRFSIWLGTTTEGGAGGGVDEVATVVYDTATGEYTVTPLTGACDVFIKQAALTATASGITEATLLTVA